jgi:hypothetical protein
MSVAINSSNGTQDRAIEAAKQLCLMLDLGTLRPAELKLLTTALAEVVAREIPHNPTLAQEVISAFSELKPSLKPRTGNAKPLKDTTGKIRNKGSVKNLRFNSFATLDPFVLYEMVGSEQLPDALRTFSIPTLKEIAASVETSENKKPASKASKDQIVEYIVQSVMRKVTHAS